MDDDDVVRIINGDSQPPDAEIAKITDQNSQLLELEQLGLIHSSSVAASSSSSSSAAPVSSTSRSLTTHSHDRSEDQKVDETPPDKLRASDGHPEKSSVPSVLLSPSLPVVADSLPLGTMSQFNFELSQTPQPQPPVIVIEDKSPVTTTAATRPQSSPLSSASASSSSSSSSSSAAVLQVPVSSVSTSLTNKVTNTVNQSMNRARSPSQPVINTRPLLWHHCPIQTSPTIQSTAITTITTITNPI